MMIYPSYLIISENEFQKSHPRNLLHINNCINKCWNFLVHKLHVDRKQLHSLCRPIVVLGSNCLSKWSHAVKSYHIHRKCIWFDRIVADIGWADIYDRMASNYFVASDFPETLCEPQSPADIVLNGFFGLALK